MTQCQWSESKSTSQRTALFAPRLLLRRTPPLRTLELWGLASENYSRTLFKLLVPIIIFAVADRRRPKTRNPSARRWPSRRRSRAHRRPKARRYRRDPARRGPRGRRLGSRGPRRRLVLIWHQRGPRARRRRADAPRVGGFDVVVRGRHRARFVVVWAGKALDVLNSSSSPAARTRGPRAT